ncbi:restriction endonuclease subunit S [Helicobacter pylori]|nr:restriction endonuclease subunit S [Helicobacter pylori]
MIGPLSSQLNAIKWGEFRLGDLFEMERGTRLTKANRIKGTRPLVTAGYENYGVAEYISNHEQKVFKGNTITIDMFANAFYRYGEYSADDNILVLTPKFTMSHRIGLCVTARINAVLKAKFSYGKQYRQKDFNVTTISLPTTQDGGIDFHFMEKFIAELEQCRLAELQAYLKATGLENTTLSSAEENALNVFNNSGGGNTPCGLTWQSFKIVDIFEVKNTRNILARDVVKDSGTTPYLCASKENNAVNSYINYNADFLDKGNCIFIGGKTFVVTYQQKDFYSNDSHNLALYLKDTHSKTKLNQLFIITCIYKALNNKYSWGDSISNTKIQNDSILLPTNPHGKIDFDFMHTLINALMKQTIQGVVQYCGAKIQATKEVINQEAPVQKDSLF